MFKDSAETLLSLPGHRLRNLCETFIIITVQDKNITPSPHHQPEMALVTDMSGECRAGVTPQTVWYPTMPARPKVVTIWVKAALGADKPRPIRVPIPVTKREYRHWALLMSYHWHRWKQNTSNSKLSSLNRHTPYYFTLKVHWNIFPSTCGRIQ